ncbi:MAG: hypothetical protein GY906_22185 [bacterium]|nr:hypothetical protein [bacterium]
MGKLVDNPVDEIMPLVLAKVAKGRWFAFNGWPDEDTDALMAHGICPRDAALQLAKKLEALYAHE